MKAVFFLFFCIAVNAQTKERWDVKTMTDGFEPSGKPIVLDVSYLEKLPIAKVGNATPRMASEKQIIQVSGTIRKIQKEADGDIHVEISDESMPDSTLPCEFVNPEDPVAKKSPWYNNFKIARTFISGKKVGDRITVTGLKFQDKFHKPSPKRIRNMVEIHPVWRAN